MTSSRISVCGAFVDCVRSAGGCLLVHKRAVPERLPLPVPYRRSRVLQNRAGVHSGRSTHSFTPSILHSYRSTETSMPALSISKTTFSSKWLSGSPRSAPFSSISPASSQRSTCSSDGAKSAASAATFGLPFNTISPSISSFSFSLSSIHQQNGRHPLQELVTDHFIPNGFHVFTLEG